MLRAPRMADAGAIRAPFGIAKCDWLAAIALI
jgi:hypothetical protein